MKTLIFLFLAVFGLSGCSSKSGNVHLPQGIAKKGKFHHTFTLNYEGQYLFEIGFSREGYSYEELKELVGYGGLCYSDQHPCPEGVPLSIEWEIKNLKGEVVSAGQKVVTNAHGWSDDWILRNIDNFNALDGNYTLHFTLLEDTPQFSGMSTEIRFWKTKE